MTIVIWLRSAIFNLLFFVWTGLLFGGIFWLLLPLPRRAMEIAVRFWSRSVIWLLRLVVGVDFQFRGLEHLPPGPCILASKHQSAWDTMIFFELLERPVFIVKPDLMKSPFYGWYARKVGMITAVRTGMGAIRSLLTQSRAALADGRQVIIFPEGTRVGVGRHVKFHQGVEALYSALDAPMIPVALNSGLFWPRRSFRKYPGCILLEFLAPVEPGLPRGAVIKDLEARIGDATDRLEREAGMSQ